MYSEYGFIHIVIYILKKEKMEEKNGKSGPFLTPNGRKFLLKQIDALSESLRAIISFKKEGGDSTKEASETEMSHSIAITVIQNKIADCKRKLKLPILNVMEQNTECRHGNGVKIHLDEKTLYVVIDGICVCNHDLPENHAIIGANSPLGQALIGKKVSEHGSYVVAGKTKNFVVEKIDLPSKSKWIFKYDDPLKKSTLVPQKELALN